MKDKRLRLEARGFSTYYVTFEPRGYFAGFSFLATDEVFQQNVLKVIRFLTFYTKKTTEICFEDEYLMQI